MVPLGSLSQQEPGSPGRRKSLAAPPPHPTIPHPCSQELLGCSGGFSGSPHSSPCILQVGPWRHRADVGTQNPRGGIGILTQISPSGPGGGVQRSAHSRNMEKGAVDSGGGLSFSPGYTRTPQSPHALQSPYVCTSFDLISPSQPYSVICIFHRERLGLRELQELPPLRTSRGI